MRTIVPRRLGFFYNLVRARQPNMPTLGVFASIFDASRRILLVRQAYASRLWTTPGGRVEPSESPILALQREAREEILCEIEIASLIGPGKKETDR